ncbi:hypothetical protein GGR58DRAFT_514306 [Xylaria digitata]|nr:hypothetical protein GGR58DRAFT_514306 [Xylaria digitata]
MPTSIPYDPSLTLMSVVNETALTPVDAAHDGLNSLISSKRGLPMTKTELKNLGVGTQALDDELKKLNAAVEKAAADYAIAKMAAEPQITELRKNMRSVHKQIEIPVDYLRSEIKAMLAADTMNMDVQYFSFDSNSQNSAAYSAQIASYVSGAVSSVLGTEQSMKVGNAASRQVSRQVNSHSIEGTLVLSVSCTHKNPSIVAPFVLHIDKAIKVQENKEKFSIISGTTFGSSFVGMVHVLNSTNTAASESMEAAAASMQRTMETAAWFGSASGKVDVDAKFASDVKNLLILTMGVIPSMVANEVVIAVDKFTKFDPKSNMEAIATVQNATSSEQATIQPIAEASRTSGQAAEMHNKAIEASLSTLATIDGTKNKILDVNSMMTALDDYLKKAAEGNSGIPINYYLKDVD